MPCSATENELTILIQRQMQSDLQKEDMKMAYILYSK